MKALRQPGINNNHVVDIGLLFTGRFVFRAAGTLILLCL